MGSHRIFNIWVQFYQCSKFNAGLTMCTIATDFPLTNSITVKWCWQSKYFSKEHDCSWLDRMYLGQCSISPHVNEIRKKDKKYGIVCLIII